MKALTSLWRGHLIAMLSGACAVFAFSPYHYWIVLCVITGVFYLTLRNLSIKAAACRGFCFGLGFFGAGIYWVYISIHLFGDASSFLAGLLVFLLDLFLAAVCFSPWCALYCWLSDKHSDSVRNVLLFSGLWVLGELFRGWFLTGFPWLFSGYSVIDTPVAAWAPVVGVYGLSLLLTLTSTSVAHWIRHPRQLSVSFVLAVCVVVILASWPLKSIQWTHPVGKPVSFNAVQGNIPQQIHWDQNYIERILHTYLKLSKRSGQNSIIIWPENAIPVIYQNMPELVASLNKQASANNNALVFGVPWAKGRDYYNAVAVLGEGQGHYLKQKLVPFGEYVPFQSLVRGLITFFNLPMSSFSQGPANQRLIQVKGYPVAIYICYEAVYPDFSARLARGSAFIITVSNDSWFGRSVGPWQNFQMVRMRALETGRYLINDTNDSATSLISPAGKVLQQIPSFHAGVLKGKVQPMEGLTPFMRYTSVPVFVLCLMMLAGALLKRERK